MGIIVGDCASGQTKLKSGRSAFSNPIQYFSQVGKLRPSHCLVTYQSQMRCHHYNKPQTVGEPLQLYSLGRFMTVLGQSFKFASFNRLKAFFVIAHMSDLTLSFVRKTSRWQTAEPLVQSFSITSLSRSSLQMNVLSSRKVSSSARTCQKVEGSV